MTTFPFQPSSVAPPQFQPTLDGALYTAIVTWNLAGQRYYVDLYTLQGVLVFTQPCIGAINFAAGYFTTSTFTFDPDASVFEVLQ